jgi:hypothetical protein
MAGMSEQLDRFARGKLSPAESRKLARQSLDNHDLFDELTSAAIARRGPAGRANRQITGPRVALLATAAAIIAGAVLYAPRPGAAPARQAAATISPPILLARNGDADGAIFRGADADSRESRATGSIRSLAGGTATIDLGSLDGLEKGADVDVWRDAQVIGHIKLTTIFRDHSRGEIAGGAAIHAGDQVRVPPAAHLRAVLDQIAATLARGDRDKAMSLAQQTSLDSFDAQLSSQDDLNNAGVIAELHGNRTEAGELYRRALQASPAAQDRQSIEKNIARLKGAK